MADAALAPPEERGRLVVADRVLEAVARAAVREVDGAATSRGRLGGALGGALPSVDVEHAGGRARVHVRVGAPWPAPAADLAQRVRERVAARLDETAGVRVDAVDVAVQPQAPDVRGGSDDATGRPASGGSSAGAAPAPTSAVALTTAACVLALGLVALGAVAVREGLVVLGAVGGSPWATGPVTALDGLAPSPAVTAVGAGAALVGLVLLLVALAPRRRRWVSVDSRSGAVLHRRDVARLAAGAARSVDGVLDAGASAGRRRVDVDVTTTSPVDDSALRAAVARRVGVLRPAPAVHVRSQVAGVTS